MKNRIGIDVGRKLSVEDAIVWASKNDVKYIDCQIDVEPNSLHSFNDGRCQSIKHDCESKNIVLGLHTLSSVNVAEFSPFVGEAVDTYLKAYVDAAARLNADWIVVHAGYHFTDDYKIRRQAALERLQRIVGYAEKNGVLLLLENTNWEPERAEVHYFIYNLEELNYFMEKIKSPHLGWSFTINHATLVPEGIEGFVKNGPTNRLGEVRMADNNGEYELHMQPGTGIIDWKKMFNLVEATGYEGHYMNAFGSLEDMLQGREYQLNVIRS